MNGNSKSQSAILGIFSWFFIINSFREVRRRRQQEKNALEAKVQEMKKKDVEAEEWKRQKQFFYEKFWTFGLGLSMLVVAGSYYWMRGWIHKYHHHPLHTFLNKMNYLTLEKKEQKYLLSIMYCDFWRRTEEFFQHHLTPLIQDWAACFLSNPKANKPTPHNNEMTLLL